MRLERITVKLTALAVLAAFALPRGIAMGATAPVPIRPTGQRADRMDKRVDYFRGSFSAREVFVRPNEVKAVAFTIRPTRDATDAVIRLTMPADLVRLVKGRTRWKGAVRRGRRVRLDFAIVADARVDVGVRADVRSRKYGSDDSSVYYLRVCTVPRTRPGRDELRHVPTYGRPLSGSTPAIKRSVAPRAGTITIKATLRYVDHRGDLQPMRRVLVYLRDEDYGLDEWVASAYTDNNGVVSLTADNNDGLWQGGRDPYLTVFSVGDVAECRDDRQLNYALDLPKAGEDVADGFNLDYGAWSTTTNQEAWEAIDAAHEEGEHIYRNSSPNWQRPTKVVIRWPEGNWPQSTGDKIYLPLRSTVSWTRSAVYHEYAHCVMYSLYGHFPSGTGPSPHYIHSESSGGFAMLEGWAEFMQSVMATNPARSIETNTWYDHQDQGDMDGDIIEGSVASVFWDIVDPTSESDKDGLARPFADLFWVMQNAQPDDIHQFWTAWTAHWPGLSTSAGPLCTTCWQYGIDKDTYAPFGINPALTIGSAADGVPPGWTNRRNVFLALNAGDYGSGPRDARFSEGGSWGRWQAYAARLDWLLGDGDGQKTVQVQFRDAKSLTSSVYAGTINLDSHAPSGRIDINDGAAGTRSAGVTLTVEASDAGGSGVASKRFSNDDASWDSEQDYGSTSRWVLDYRGDGTKTVYVRFRDRVGNLSPSFTDTIVLRRPKATLGRPYAPAYARRNRAFVSYGTLKPRHPANGHSVQVYCYRLEQGRYRYKTRFYPHNRNIRGGTKYVGSVKLWLRGSWKLRAVHECPNHVTTLSSCTYTRVR